jgi:hypothetical protein
MSQPSYFSKPERGTLFALLLVTMALLCFSAGVRGDESPGVTVTNSVVKVVSPIDDRADGTNETNGTNLVLPPAVDDLLTAWIVRLVRAWPKLGAVIVLMGVARPFMKPLSLVIHKYVLSTATKKDDEWLQRVDNSPFLKTSFFLLDLVLSIKVVPPRQLVITKQNP